MIVATCIGKEKKGNIINSIVLQDTNGTIKKMAPSDVKRAMRMHALAVNNLKIDAAGRLIAAKSSTVATTNANTFNNPAGKAASKAELLGYRVQYIFEECQLWFKDDVIQLYIPDHVNKLSYSQQKKSYTSRGTYRYWDDVYLFQYLKGMHDKKLIVRGGLNLTDMTRAFKDLRVRELDLQNLNTGKITNMTEMFQNATIEKITFGDKFNTSNVFSMAGMFFNADIPSLDLSMFNTEKVTNMYEMFKGCKAEPINLSSFVANNKVDLEGMFDKYKGRIICNDTKIINEYNNRKFGG